jgi:hypothetical protein
MGGSGGGGGGYFGKGDIVKLQKQVQEAQDESKKAEYVAACNAYLTSLLADFNDRDDDAIDVFLDEILEALEKKLTGSIKLRFGGSVAKHTFVDGVSDVDSLLLLDSCELADKSPNVAKKELAGILKAKFPTATVTEGKLAITLIRGDLEIQLLPAVSCRNNVKITATNGKEWSTIQPKKFTDALTSANKQLSGKLVPTIKLAKALIATLPAQQQISGYHLEALAIEAFKGYKAPPTPAAILHHFFSKASQLVLRPIKDRTGQSVHVDDKLGDAQSLERRIISGAFSRFARRMSNADAASNVDDWKVMFGDQ